MAGGGSTRRLPLAPRLRRKEEYQVEKGSVMRAPSGPDVVVHALPATPSPLTQAETPHPPSRVKTSVLPKCFVINAGTYGTYVATHRPEPSLSPSRSVIKRSTISITVCALREKRKKFHRPIYSRF